MGVAAETVCSIAGMRVCAFLTSVLLIACAAALADPVAPAPGAAAPSGEYARHDEGWFFYKDPPPEAAKKKPPPQTSVPAQAPALKEEVGSVAWIRDHINEFRDRAIDDPTPENLELFGYVQKMMMDKAEVFATKFVQTTNQNPALDEGINNPRSSVAKQTQYTVIDESFDKLMKKLSKQVAIWYFFRSDCPYCQKQDPVLTQYLGHYGFSILPISTDGAPLLDGSFPDWVPDQGQAAYLNVTSTPTMYVVRPPKDVILLAVGVKAGKELAERMIDIAHEQKWISDAEYDDAVKGLPRRYLTSAFDPSSITDPTDPAQLLKAFRASGTFSTMSADLQNVEDARGESSPLKPHAAH